METTYGQVITGLAADGRELRSGVFNENEVRAAAGLTMVAGAVAFAYAYFDKNYVPLQAVATFFFVEFLIRVTFGLRCSPVGVVARALTRRQPPDWVSAKPKRFAWTLGLAHVARDDDHHEQRHPRPPAADDLPRLPDADVAGVGARLVPGLRDPRLARAARVGERGRARSRSARTAVRSDLA